MSRASLALDVKKLHKFHLNTLVARCESVFLASFMYHATLTYCISSSYYIVLVNILNYIRLHDVLHDLQEYCYRYFMLQ